MANAVVQVNQSSCNQQSIRCLFCALVLACCNLPAPHLVAGVPQAETKERNALSPNALFIRPPRELERPLLRAKKALQENDSRMAVELLGQILASPVHGGYLQELEGNPWRSISIHDQAHKLMSAIPRTQRRDYELRYDVTAKQMLEQAVTDGDFTAMALVARRYFFTESGALATLLLGHHYLESGQPVSAAASFQSLVENDDLRSRFDPEVSVMLAISRLVTGERSSAVATLQALVNRHAGQQVRVGDESIRLAINDSEIEGWLDDLVGSAAMSRYQAVGDWLMFRGNPERNASSGSGFALPYPRWFVPTLNNPDFESAAAGLYLSRLSRQQSLIPSLQPLAIGNTIAVRSLHKTIGIDVRTGMRVWEYPAWDHSSQYQNEHVELVADSQTEKHQIEERVWRDHLYGQMASNGRYLFVIDNPGFAAETDQQMVGGRNFRMDNPFGGRATNELKAVSLAREGAFCWEVGGESGGRVPELAGGFFLGAPLVLEDELYLLAELPGEIRLVVLDQESGDMLWSQQVAAIDGTVGPISRDHLRRLAGTTPSYSNGVIVCPTTAYGIVAVDRVTRSLLWGTQYLQPDSELRSTSLRSHAAEIRSRHGKGEAVAIDSSILISEGRIIATPLESDRVMCLDLMSGEMLWKSEPFDRWEVAAPIPNIEGSPIEDSLFVACSHKGQVVLIGRTKVRSLGLYDGELLWEESLATAGMPSGRGYLAGDRYYFPTADKKLVEVDLNGRTISRTVDTNFVLGNLICHQGQLISMGHDVVSAFDQTEFIKRRVADFELDPGNSNLAAEQVMRWKVQLLSQSGDLVGAVRLADEAFQLTGEAVERELATDLLLDLMEQDYQAARIFLSRYETDLLKRGSIRYVHARFAGLLDDGKLSEALALLYGQGFESGQDVDQFVVAEFGALRIRLDAQLRNKFQSLNGASQSQARKQLKEWCAQNRGPESTQKLVVLSRLLGTNHLPIEELPRLVRLRLDGQEFLQAERLLRSINVRMDSEDQPDGLMVSEELRAEVDALEIRMFNEAGWQSEWQERLHQHQVMFADIQYNDPWTAAKTSGAEFSTKFDDQRVARATIAFDDWNYGDVKAAVAMTRARGANYPGVSVIPRCNHRTGRFSDVQLEVEMQRSLLQVRDHLGKMIGEVTYRKDNAGRSYYSPFSHQGSYSLYGNLLLFSYGYDLVAVDLNRLKKKQSGLLWHKNLEQEPASTGQVRSSGYRTQSLRNPWGLDRYVIHGRNEKSPLDNVVANSESVFFRIGSEIHGVDALTGKTLWRRSNLTDSGWLVASENRVALLHSIDGSATAGLFESATVMDAGTGAIEKQVDLAAYKRMSLWHDSSLNLVFTSRSGQEQGLACFNLNQEQETWSRAWPVNSSGAIRDSETMVVATSEGAMEYLNLLTGQTQFELSIDKESIAKFEIMKLQEHDLILVSGERSTRNFVPENIPVSLRGVMSGQLLLFDGKIYSVDRAKRKMTWQSPIRAQHFSIPKRQPAAIPVLTMHRVVSVQGASSRRANSIVELYSIDLRDGRLADVQRVKNWDVTTIDIELMPDQNSIVHHFNGRKLTVDLKKGELPPVASAVLTDEETLKETIAMLNVKSSDDGKKSKQEELLRRLKEGNKEGNENE